jgi:hypoxanthine phosphoribosyltransferase
LRAIFLNFAIKGIVVFLEFIKINGMKEKIKVRDKEFSVFIKAADIDTAVSRMADTINQELKGKVPLFLVVLNGAFMFASDLMKKIKIENNISFVKLSSYTGTRSSQVVNELIGINEVVKGRTVVIVEDIIDSGITMRRMLDILSEQEAADVRIATLVFKPNAFQSDFKINYIGMEIPNDFIIGYGLDYDGFARNLPDIYKIVE